MKFIILTVSELITSNSMIKLSSDCKVKLAVFNHYEIAIFIGMSPSILKLLKTLQYLISCFLNSFIYFMIFLTHLTINYIIFHLDLNYMYTLYFTLLLAF